tara:strand:+ start:922 stop:1401 length:480 start_codon:yes stop_codon:yes gene_type:complete
MSTLRVDSIQVQNNTSTLHIPNSMVNHREYTLDASGQLTVSLSSGALSSALWSDTYTPKFSNSILHFTFTRLWLINAGVSNSEVDFEFHIGGSLAMKCRNQTRGYNCPSLDVTHQMTTTSTSALTLEAKVRAVASNGGTVYMTNDNNTNARLFVMEIAQ